MGGVRGRWTGRGLRLLAGFAAMLLLRADSQQLQRYTSAVSGSRSDLELHTSVSAPAVRSVVSAQRPLRTLQPARRETSPAVGHRVAAPAAAAAAQPERRLERAAARVPDCQGDLRLVASAVNGARPGLSRAVVRNATGSFLVGLGGRVAEFTVEAIEPARAELRSATGARCSLTGFSGAASAVEPPPQVVAPTPEPKARAMFSREELADGVRALGAGEYAVSRQLLLRGLANPGGAAGGAWFRPHKGDGQSLGMEVRAVRDGSVLKAMGMESGDIARSVNGIATDSPEGLLAALRSVLKADTITISVVRDGRARALRYYVD
jgi:hypothetical protein